MLIQICHIMWRHLERLRAYFTFIFISNDVTDVVGVDTFFAFKCNKGFDCVLGLRKGTSKFGICKIAKSY